MSRAASAAMVVLALLSVTSCVSAVSGSPVSEPQAASPSPEPPRFAPSVREPRDARGVAACELLTDVQLAELGLLAASARPSTTSTTQSCGWLSAVDDTNPAGLELVVGTAIAALDTIYIARDLYVNFTELEIAGHPAVRADYNPDGTCTIYTAIADHQGVSTEGNPAGRPQPDPCALSVRMAELILSNLPPLTEE